jgi:TonB-dependent SusC/RagA subfamily outer membrane receptor
VSRRPPLSSLAWPLVPYTSLFRAQAACERLVRPLFAAWGAGSLALIAWPARSHRTLRRRRRAWREAVVDEVPPPVLVAPDVGPAVVGLAHARVVLPAWALDVDPQERALMLAHEREHVRALDPLLLAAATAAAALAPWSPALWWQLRRLRLAVEVDCDRRVLRRHPDVRAYGGLLLDVARRAHPEHPASRLAAAALASPATSLERRIRIMTSRPRRTALQAAALSTAAVALTIAACEAPRPTAPRPQARAPLTSIVSASPDVASGSGLTETKIRAALEKHYPAVLDHKTGRQQRVWFVADTAGFIVQSDWERSGGSTAPGLGSVDPNTIGSIDIVKLAPGRITPDSLAVVWVALKKVGEKVTVRGEGMTMTGARVTRVDANRVTVAGAAAKAQPLYLLDGKEISAAEMQALAPDAIESVEVLKGAAATAKHGDRGANGVVTITTKKGAPTTRDY